MAMLIASLFGTVITPARAAGCTVAVVSVTSFPTSFSDNAFFTCSAAGTTTTGTSIPKRNWDPNVFTISGPITVHINITDSGSIGDFYQLWMTIDTSLATGWFKLGTTPKVHTDSALVAPAFSFLWDGTGKTFSTATFILTIPSGTKMLFRVNDPLFLQMGKHLTTPCAESTLTLLTLGCSVPGVSVSPGWNPGPFTIKFS